MLNVIHSHIQKFYVKNLKTHDNQPKNKKYSGTNLHFTKKCTLRYSRIDDCLSKIQTQYSGLDFPDRAKSSCCCDLIFVMINYKKINMMKSPLFVSAIELLAHATELFGEKNERKYKFVILHLANSVELILKDKLLVEGKSIYSTKNQNLTLGIWDSFKCLDEAGIKIPEKPVIELLVDDRNTIQHRFGFPNEEAVFFYLSSTKDFYSRFLKEEYNTTLGEELKPYLTKENMELLGISKSEIDHLKKLREVSIEMAILQISSDIEKVSYDIIKSYRETKDLKNEGIRRKLSMPLMFTMNFLLRGLLNSELISDEKYSELKSKYHMFRDYRNQISHGRLEKKISKKQLETVYDSGIELLVEIKKGVDENVFTTERLDEIFGFNEDEPKDE